MRTARWIRDSHAEPQVFVGPTPRPQTNRAWMRPAPGKAGVTVPNAALYTGAPALSLSPGGHTRQPSGGLQVSDLSEDRGVRSRVLARRKFLGIGARRRGCGYGSSGGGLTRNPLWPLQESPGWKPVALRSAGVAPKNSLL